MDKEPNDNELNTNDDGAMDSTETPKDDFAQDAPKENYQSPQIEPEPATEPAQPGQPTNPAGTPPEHTTNKAIWIVMIVFALLIGGGLGYIFGNNFATVNNSETDALQQQVTNLEADLADAKDDLDEAQKDTTMDDKVTELEKENAALEQQVSDLEAEVADLKDQLEEAQTESTSSTDSTR